jgi:site-specific DNA recombinase
MKKKPIKPPAWNEKKVFRCAIYTRVSTDEKKLDENGVMRGRKEDHSLKMQEDFCRSYLKIRKDEGYVVGEVYTDDGFSAKDQKRPALQRMFRAIEAGEIDAVIVYKIDRLTRSVADFYDIREICALFPRVRVLTRRRSEDD